ISLFTLSLHDALPIFVFMLITFNNNYMLARKKASLSWEKLIENDEHRLAVFYRFVSQFANVPQTFKRLKKRKFLAQIIERIVPRSEEHTSELQSRFDL